MNPLRLILAAMLIAAGCTASDAPREGVAPSPPRRSAAGPTDSPAAMPTAMPTVVNPRVTGWWAWALLDRRTGRITGSANRDTETTTTESMVKAWLAADHLAGLEHTGRGLTDSGRDLIRQTLRVSDDVAAESLYQQRGGDAAIYRMINTCQLTGTRVHPGHWALTRITARDAVRLGGCLASGAVLGPRWTEWLMSEMRQVAPSNRFGIREAFRPDLAARIAVKNGWTPRWDTGMWHVNCLGIWDRWSLAVLTRYPVRLGLGYGAAACREVTRQLFVGPGRAR